MKMESGSAWRQWCWWSCGRQHGRQVTIIVSRHESICRSSAVDAARLNTARILSFRNGQSTHRTIGRVGGGVWFSGWCRLTKMTPVFAAKFSYPNAKVVGRSNTGPSYRPLKARRISHQSPSGSLGKSKAPSDLALGSASLQLHTAWAWATLVLSGGS